MAYLGRSVLVGNTVRANNAPSALELYGSNATLIHNTLIANTASNSALVLCNSDAALYETMVISNTAGSGLFLRGSSAALTNTVVTNNRPSTSGGYGLYITDGSFPRLVHTTIAHNGGSEGTGVYVPAFSEGEAVAVTMTNTILLGHKWGIYVSSMSDAATLDGTLWGNTFDSYGLGTTITGTHNYWGDPRFAADGYHLLSGSAAIDRGVNAGVTNDIDGDTRTGIPDLGADEAATSDWHYIYLPVVVRQ